MNPHTCSLQSSWLGYWNNILRIVKDGGIISQPLRGVVYQKHEATKTLTIIAQDKEYPCSDTAILNRRCIEAIGWREEIKLLPLADVCSLAEKAFVASHSADHNLVMFLAQLKVEEMGDPERN